MEKTCSLCKEVKPIENFYFERPGQRSARCRKCRARITSSWRRKNPSIISGYRKSNAMKLRRSIFEHYGLKCSCCNEDELVFLVLDHIQDDGGKQRKELNLKSGEPFYRWIKNNGFPVGFQTLCHNCNHAKRLGVCPHQKNTGSANR